MSQASHVIADSDGTVFLAALNAALLANASMHSGATEPSYKTAGMLWRDTSATPWLIKQYDGTDWITWGSVNATTNLFTPIGAGGVPTPQGRLCLQTAEPVPGSTARTGKTVIYYALYEGNQVPIYDGSSAFVSTTFTELQNDLTQSSTNKAGPAAATTNSNYDLFVWSDSGTIRLTRGPLWTSDTARGTGAGTTELERKLGIWTNKVAITNGPGANLGTYVGTIRTDGSSQANWQPGGAAAGGTAALLNVWNAYNRVSVSGVVSDTTTSWNYTTFTWRSADNSAANRVSFIIGLQEDFISACYQVGALNSSGNSFNAGIGYDSTTAPSGVTGAGNSTVQTEIMARCRQQPLGFHYFQALEVSAAVGTSTWYGVFNAQVAGLDYSGRF